MLDRIRSPRLFRTLPEFTVDVVDEAGQVVARVKKQLYARLKRRSREPALDQA